MVEVKDQNKPNEELDLEDLIDQLGKILAEEYISLIKENEEEKEDV